jgi:hypothetical protein
MALLKIKKMEMKNNYEVNWKRNRNKGNECC